MAKPNTIFVFGSNLAGRHGKGAAKFAKDTFGAEYGIGVGRTGASYAIPTKDKDLSVLPLEEIEKYVKEFIAYTITNKDLRFYITRVGCGLAGYKDEQIAPLFKGISSNCDVPKEWEKYV